MVPQQIATVTFSCIFLQVNATTTVIQNLGLDGQTPISNSRLCSKCSHGMLFYAHYSQSSEIIRFYKKINLILIHLYIEIAQTRSLLLIHSCIYSQMALLNSIFLVLTLNSQLYLFLNGIAQFCFLCVTHLPICQCLTMIKVRK